MDLKCAATVGAVVVTVPGAFHQVFQTYKFKCGVQVAAPAATAVVAGHLGDPVVHTWFYSFA